ncbi:hypothetical protein QBC32DRAFT_381500, partial [Pseudoneurospora amorphoporcata]
KVWGRYTFEILVGQTVRQYSSLRSVLSTPRFLPEHCKTINSLDSTRLILKVSIIHIPKLNPYNMKRPWSVYNSGSGFSNANTGSGAQYNNNAAGTQYNYNYYRPLKRLQDKVHEDYLCLAKLWSGDPRDPHVEKERIELAKGGLLADAYR